MRSVINSRAGQFPQTGRQAGCLRTRALTRPYALCLMACIAMPCLAESESDAAPMTATEQGTALILDMILEEHDADQTLQPADAAPAMQTSESPDFTESEQVIDLDALTPEARARLEASVGSWVNHVESADAPSSTIEWVEPVQVRELSEQLVGEAELTPELLAQFPAMKTAPLPEPVQPEPQIETEVAPAAAAAPDAAGTESPAQQNSIASVQGIKPRVTRWSGRPAMN